MSFGKQEDQNAEKTPQAGRNRREVATIAGARNTVALKSDQVRKLKELEAENARLRRAVSDLTLDKMILAEAALGNF
jgi:cell division protein FtsB